MPLKTDGLQSHRHLEGSSGATALGSRGPSLDSPYLGGGSSIMKTACFGSGKPTASREDLVLEKAGVGERKLALKLDRLDRESKAHMKMREREEKAMRQMGRNIRKHRTFDDTSVGRKVDSLSGGNRLLPPISTPESSPRNIRRVRSTPNSPINNRKAIHSASPCRTPTTSSSGNLAIPDSDQDSPGLRVRSAGPGLSPAVLHNRSRSTSNLPGAAGYSSGGSHGAPAITVYPYPEGKKQHSNPDLSGTSTLTPAAPSSPTSNPTKQRPWERGLTPARRARTPAELFKVQGSVSYLTPALQSKNDLRPYKSEGNLSTTGVERSADDPRFMKLASCLVRNDDSCPVSSDESKEDQDGPRSPSVEALNQEMVAIRITSSTPTLPHSHGDSKRPTPPLPGHLKEPGGSLPPLKAHNPRAPSPRILVNTTESSADGEGAVVTEETVELNRDSLPRGAGAPPRELIIPDTDRLKPADMTEAVKSPPFYTKTSVSDW